MMTALPNQNATFTCTLFMPFVRFEDIKAKGGRAPVDFFEKYFPDAVPLIGEEAIKKTFKQSEGLPLVSIKVSTSVGFSVLSLYTWLPLLS